MHTATEATLIKFVGELIANGYGIRRPRLKADDFSGRIELDGVAYWAKVRWPDGAEDHEVAATFRRLSR